MNNIILLSEEKILAKGGEKLVYLHPQDPDKLIKVINPDYIEFMKKNRSITSRFRRLTCYWFFSNMVTEHIASRELDIEKKHFLQNIVGFVDTDLGLGIVTKAIKDKQGNLGKTLGDLLKKNEYGPNHKKAIDEFIIWMKKTNIIIRDLWLDNLVWNEIDHHFVLVDRIGGRYLPTLRAYWQWYNLRGNRNRALKLLKRIEEHTKR